MLLMVYISLYEFFILINLWYLVVIGEVDLDMVVSEGEGFELEEILKFVCECCLWGLCYFWIYEELLWVF